MGYHLEINSLLKIPKQAFNLSKIKKGEKYGVEKKGERLYPLNIPVDICDGKYVYYGKVAVRKLTLEKNKTYLEIEILKVYNKEESRIFTKNFIKESGKQK